MVWTGLVKRRSQPSHREKRAPITRHRVLDEALTLTDAGGAGALTIRAVAEHLGVTPMALYHHVRNKDEIVNGMLDLVMGEIALPAFRGAWQTEMARRAASARRVLNAHPWAIHLLQAGSAPCPATLRHHNAVIGVLRDAGFTVAQTGRMPSPCWTATSTASRCPRPPCPSAARKPSPRWPSR